MKRRKPKPGDQDNGCVIYGALGEILKDLQRRTALEGSLFMGPMMAIIADTYKESGVPYEEYKREMCEMVEFYRY